LCDKSKGANYNAPAVRTWATGEDLLLKELHQTAHPPPWNLGTRLKHGDKEGCKALKSEVGGG
jgi:hypothetical protein